MFVLSQSLRRRFNFFRINVQGLSHNTPTDDDISNVLKEFTVDFLLKGYNSLVRTLHTQILTNIQLEIDTSHFFLACNILFKVRHSDRIRSGTRLFCLVV